MVVHVQRAAPGREAGESSAGDEEVRVEATGRAVICVDVYWST
jgi:hypothetical protein